MRNIPRMGRWIVAVAGVITLIVWAAGQRFSTGAESGVALYDYVQPAKGTPESWRIATWNIHGAKGRDRVTDLARIREGISRFDFVGLNEVRGCSGLWGSCQTANLGRELQAGWLFLPFESRFGRDDFGNGVISRSPVGDWVRIPLPATCVKGHGNVTLLRVAHFNVPVHVLVTHVDHKTDRTRQLAVVLELFTSLQSPAVLMGDLNTRDDDQALARVLSEPGVLDPFAVLGRHRPAGQIDWILVKGLDCMDVGFEDNPASDHPLVWAELTLPRSASIPNDPDPGIHAAGHAPDVEHETR